MCLLKETSRPQVKVSSSTIKIYTHAGNRELGKAKSPLNSLQMKMCKIIISFIPPNWQDIRHQCRYE